LKNLLFNEKSIREEKYTVNGKNRAKDWETPEEKGTLQIWTLQINGDVVLMKMEAFLPFLLIEMG
jgi:hypothetical protein